MQFPRGDAVLPHMMQLLDYNVFQQYPTQNSNLAPGYSIDKLSFVDESPESNGRSVGLGETWWGSHRD